MAVKSERKRLPHTVPFWVADDAVFFITMNALPRCGSPLTENDTAQKLWDTILFNTNKRLWWPHLVLVMPDHLHALMSFSLTTGMMKSLGNWKHYTARMYGIRWQRDFFDHRLRGDEAHIEKAYYIRQNPVRKGLVDDANDWPYAWTMGKGI
ncbi:MAG: hypothetical protein ISS35_06650 [Kiritimatiellae bacterium]|nr:hypothetical protein [Kiritimatiellia bacterium]